MTAQKELSIFIMEQFRGLLVAIIAKRINFDNNIPGYLP
jgi:hypothetical protein